MTIAPLVASGDSDLAAWQAGSQNVFLEMACAEVRRFCGWHIAPAVAVVSKVCWIGARGMVVLNSTHVSSVDEVVLGYQNPQVLELWRDYNWDQPKPWLRLHPHTSPFPYCGSHMDPHVRVSYTHGFDECPIDVKAVIAEVMSTAMELPASNANQLTTMQYNFHLNSNIGVALSEEQKNRLSGYVMRKFGGSTRP